MRLAAALALVLIAVAARAADPLPPMAGLNASAVKERAELFAELAAAKDDVEARAVEDRLWTFWRSFADERSRELLEASRQAQLEFDYAHAFIAMQELVKHQPDFAEGWNQYGYVLFLAGDYEASLQAIDKVLTLEPMHYAALAGKGIILTQQGKVDEAQAPLKRALAINPWLKERNLIGENPLLVP
ncbi:MAG TPA: tetratricopeptide repeat protein [Pseudolabrys sp.]|nr:tetratricopeptide repeat protein [Pseudolabrys sp.]